MWEMRWAGILGYRSIDRSLSVGIADRSLAGVRGGQDSLPLPYVAEYKNALLILFDKPPFCLYVMLLVDLTYKS